MKLVALAAGRRGGISAFCGSQVPPNQTSFRQPALVWTSIQTHGHAIKWRRCRRRKQWKKEQPPPKSGFHRRYMCTLGWSQTKPGVGSLVSTIHSLHRSCSKSSSPHDFRPKTQTAMKHWNSQSIQTTTSRKWTMFVKDRAGHLAYVGDLLCTSFLIIISDRDDVHLDTEIHMGKLHP